MIDTALGGGGPGAGGIVPEFVGDDGAAKAVGGDAVVELVGGGCRFGIGCACSIIAHEYDSIVRARIRLSGNISRCLPSISALVYLL